MKIMDEQFADAERLDALKAAFYVVNRGNHAGIGAAIDTGIVAAARVTNHIVNFVPGGPLTLSAGELLSRNQNPERMTFGMYDASGL
jgi:hypothetical protein